MRYDKRRGRRYLGYQRKQMMREHPGYYGNELDWDKYEV